MKRRRKDSGFALLLVLLTAAVIAITLYAEIPRVAFESQRQKEQLLIERGEQYKRAIQLFVKANQRWPGRIEELESFNNRHYLRQRYKDPMTGKDEWRIVHIQNGILTDSVTTKQQQNANQQQGSSTLGQYVGVQAGIGQQPVNLPGQGGGGVNMATRQRASDRSLAGVGQGEMQQDPQMQSAGIAPGQQQGQTGQGQFQQGQPQQGQPSPGPPIPGGYGAFQGMPPQPGQQQGQIAFGQPGQPGSQLVYNPAGQPMPSNPGAGGINPGGIRAGNFGNTNTGNTNTGSTYVGGSGPYVGGGGAYVGGGSAIGSQPTNPTPGPFGGQQFNPQLPPQPGPAVNSQTGGVSPYSTTPGAAGQAPSFGQPGLNPNPQQQNAAAQMISQILTTPRPGGVPQGVQGGIVGAGIAGVASNAEDDSIMVYNDRTNYGEWEFIFDPLKQKVPPNPLTGAIGNPAAGMNLGQQGQNPANRTPGTTPTGQQPFGQQPFGQQPIGQQPIGQQPIGQQPVISPFGGQPAIPPVRKQ
jgi:type II secretory pathway pseudopilin PulG